MGACPQFYSCCTVFHKDLPLAPLFLLYTAEVFDIIASFRLTGHSYDDTQVYISVPVSETQLLHDWRNVSDASISGWGGGEQIEAEC